MAEFSGNWVHNSYIVNPNQEKLPNEPGTEIGAVKWATGTLRVDDGATRSGRLEFPNGAALLVKFDVRTEADGIRFEARGTGPAGPLAGLEYELSGWAAADADDRISTVSGAIRSVRGGGPGGDLGLGGQPVGAIGFFRLSR